MKTQVNISTEIGQKLAQLVLTKALVDKFNLHSIAQAKEIIETAKKNGLNPMEIVGFLKAELPKLVEEFLANTSYEVDRFTSLEKK